MIFSQTMLLAALAFVSVSVAACKTDGPSTSTEASAKVTTTKDSNGFNLAANGKAVTCFGEDNYSFDLNAKRTTVKVTVEGESLGAKSITKRDSDGDTYVSYKTSQGTLRLDDRGNTYTFTDTPKEPWKVDCK